MVERKKACDIYDRSGRDVGEVEAVQSQEDIFWPGRTIALLWTLELDGKEWTFIAHGVARKVAVGTHDCDVRL